MREAESTAQAFRTIYNRERMKSFYKSDSAKAFDSFTKGGILLFSKEAIINRSTAANPQCVYMYTHRA